MSESLVANIALPDTSPANAAELLYKKPGSGGTLAGENSGGTLAGENSGGRLAGENSGGTNGIGALLYGSDRGDVSGRARVVKRDRFFEGQMVANGMSESRQGSDPWGAHAALLQVTKYTQAGTWVCIVMYVYMYVSHGRGATLGVRMRRCCR